MGGRSLSQVCCRENMDIAKPFLRSGNVIRNFVFEKNSPKKVALLFGWAAGDIKHVVKYTKCWEEHVGQAVVMTTPLGLRRRQSEEQIREKVNLMLQQVEDLESREVYIGSVIGRFGAGAGSGVLRKRAKGVSACQYVCLLHYVLHVGDAAVCRRSFAH